MIRPALGKTAVSRQFLPLSIRLLPLSIRNLAASILPWKSYQQLRNILHVMDCYSEEVFEAKKKALAKGDEAVMRQIGQGKDIMSILSMRERIIIL